LSGLRQRLILFATGPVVYDYATKNLTAATTEEAQSDLFHLMYQLLGLLCDGWNLVEMCPECRGGKNGHVSRSGSVLLSHYYFRSKLKTFWLWRSLPVVLLPWLSRLELGLGIYSSSSRIKLLVWASYRDLNWSFHIFVGRPWHLLPFRLFDRSTSGFGFQTFVPTVMVIYFDIFISVLISVIPKFFSSIFITAVVISFVAPSDRR